MPKVKTTLEFRRECIEPLADMESRLKSLIQYMDAYYEWDINQIMELLLAFECWIGQCRTTLRRWRSDYGE